MAGLSLTVGDAKGNEFLETGVYLVMHGRILGYDATNFPKETALAAEIVPFSSLDV